MAIVPFPASPSDGDTHDTGNGVTYTYKASIGVWVLPESSGGGGSNPITIGPFSAGQTASDWLWSANATNTTAQNNDVTAPPGPTSSGYWLIMDHKSLERSSQAFTYAEARGAMTGFVLPGQVVEGDQGGNDMAIVCLWVAT